MRISDQDLSLSSRKLPMHYATYQRPKPLIDESLSAEPDDSNFTQRMMIRLLKKPLIRLDRKKFLIEQLEGYIDDEKLSDVVENGPPQANIPMKLIEKLADACIKSQIRKASALSFVTGLPGGPVMIATATADIVQYFEQAKVLAQKLAYLYGMDDLFASKDVDELTNNRLIELMAVMTVGAAAVQGLRTASERLAVGVATRLSQKALTQTFYYPLVKEMARWVGLHITKQSFSKGVSKTIPVAGGVASAVITRRMMRNKAKKLQNHLHGIAFSNHGIAFSDHVFVVSSGGSCEMVVLDG